MTQATHIVQSNGRSRGPLTDSVRPFPDQIGFSLNRMNGTSFWPVEPEVVEAYRGRVPDELVEIWE